MNVHKEVFGFKNLNRKFIASGVTCYETVKKIIGTAQSYFVQLEAATIYKNGNKNRKGISISLINSIMIDRQ